MTSFATTILIHAASERIWSLLTDAAGYPTWNSTVERVEGTISPGERLEVYAKATPGRAFPLRVTGFEPGRSMIWSGGMPMGLFKGTRTFTLTPRGSGLTEFAMREEFGGLLAPIVTRSIPDLQPTFDRFAADLKVASESQE